MFIRTKDSKYIRGKICRTSIITFAGECIIFYLNDITDINSLTSISLIDILTISETLPSTNNNTSDILT